jgi:hypothetical protein
LKSRRAGPEPREGTREPALRYKGQRTLHLRGPQEPVSQIVRVDVESGDRVRWVVVERSRALGMQKLNLEGTLRKKSGPSSGAVPQGLKSLRENSAYEPISRQRSANPVPYTQIVFVWRSWKNGKWHIESHYPTQAKRRLERGTQHLLPVWQKLW